MENNTIEPLAARPPCRPVVIPQLLTAELILEHYLPVALKTFQRLVSAGKFPPVDVSIGAKLRFWKRQSVEEWIDTHKERGDQ